MARPLKRGLDYFPHDTDASSDRKVQYLEAKHGLTGYAVWHKLLERIYADEGYFCPWSDMDATIFARSCGLLLQELHDIVSTALEVGLFSSPMFETQGILTSIAIQRRYLLAVEKRRRVVFIRDYLLLDPEPLMPATVRIEYSGEDDCVPQTRPEKTPENAGKTVCDPQTPVISPQTHFCGEQTLICDTQSTQRKVKNLNPPLPPLSNDTGNSASPRPSLPKHENRDSAPRKDRRRVTDVGDAEPIVTPDSDDEKLVQLLIEHRSKANPRLKQPDEAKLSRWAWMFARIRANMDTNAEEIRRIIAWAGTDTFWRGRLLDPRDVLRNFEKLQTRLRESAGTPPAHDPEKERARHEEIMHASALTREASECMKHHGDRGLCGAERNCHERCSKCPARDEALPDPDAVRDLLGKFKRGFNGAQAGAVVPGFA